MSGAVRATCRAKLNLFLEVEGRRADGFHDLVTVFHEIDLADTLTLGPGDAPGLSVAIRGDVAGVPADASNLAARAVELVCTEAGRQPGSALMLTLEKRVPVGAGLGGGSADAAGALRAANDVLGLGWDAGRLRDLGARLGSDVPFLVEGGTALARGRGERLEPADGGPGLSFLLIVPTFPLPTPAVFGALDAASCGGRSPVPTLEALAAGDADALSAAFHNALSPAAERVEPRLGALRRDAESALGRRVLMTGSGSTLFVPLAEGSPPVVEHPLIARTLIARSRGTR